MLVTQDLEWCKTHIFRLVLVWNVTRMEQRCNFRDLVGAETSSGWRWDANVETWIEVSHDLGHSGLRMCVSPPSMSCLTSFQVPKFLSHLHPWTGSFPSRSKDSYLTFIHVHFHFRLGNYIGISPPNMSRLAYNQDWVLCLAFIQVTVNWHVGQENNISAPF